jgi:hypothetical protein
MAAGKRISELSDASTLDGAELLEVVQSNANKKITLSLLLRIAQLGTNWFASITTALGSGWQEALSSAYPNAAISASSWQAILLNATGPFEIKPFQAGLIAQMGTVKLTGTGTSYVAFSCMSSAAFSSVSIGDYVVNTATGDSARVLGILSTSRIFLSSDIFTESSLAYAIYPSISLPAQFIELTGSCLDNQTANRTNSSVTTSALVDSGSTSWTTSLVPIGSWVRNMTTGEMARVTAVATHQIMLSAHIFTATSQYYQIFADNITISKASSPLNGKIIPEMNISERGLIGNAGGMMSLMDVLMSHIHYAPWFGGAGIASGLAAANGAGGYTKGYGNTDTPHSDDISGTPHNGNRTRQRSVTTTWIMRVY